MSKTFHGRRQLNEWLRFPLKKMHQKRGFAEGKLLTDWPQVVGTALAQHCVPQKLSFPKGQNGATLHVLCESGWAMELQFQQEIICEKIAQFFGYRAIDQLRIHQGPLPKKENSPIKRSNNSAEPVPEDLQRQLEMIEDEEIKNALLSLGLSRSKRDKVEKQTELDDMKT